MKRAALATPFATVLLLAGCTGVAGMGVPPVGTGLTVRFAAAAPTLAAAVSVSAFNGGTALGVLAVAVMAVLWLKRLSSRA